jgi:hypothetical protein
MLSLSKLLIASVSLCLGATSIASASSESKQTSTNFEAENIDAALKRFTRAPHPMASAEQRKLTQDIKADLSKDGWDVQIQKFKTKIPNLAAARFGGGDKKAADTKEVEGENIVAMLKGNDRCLVLVGGHYDTKVFKDFRFVGANDGGSSTAAMQEMARVVAQVKKQETASKSSENGRYLDCSIALTFFDGEEATLPEWNDAEHSIGLQDNIYGSRAFANQLQKTFEGVVYKGLPIKAALIIDMIGHQNQVLFITNGSSPQLAQKFLGQRSSTRIGVVNAPIEDDHLPLLNLGVPLLHIIDWTNLSEWHKATDTMEIISSKNIALFGDMVVRFFKQKR